MLQLVKNKLTGIYETVQKDSPKPPVIDTSGYDAYVNTKKSTLATGAEAGADLGQQTESLLQRDTGGQLIYDAATQSFKRTGDAQSSIGVDKITDIGGLMMDSLYEKDNNNCIIVGTGDKKCCS